MDGFGRTQYRERTPFFDGTHPGLDEDRFAEPAPRPDRILRTARHGDDPAGLAARGRNLPAHLPGKRG